MPPVLRKTEPDDNHFVMLPGRTPAPVAVPAPAPAPAPVKAFTPPVSASPAKVLQTAERHEPPVPELKDPGRPILSRAPRPTYPDDFEKDSGLFCQKQIGHWKQVEALALLGAPSGDRPAYDDNEGVNGRILAFGDPTDRYKQLELDFDGQTGALRTVFVYPWKMTWQDCRRLWGANVSAAEANKGRKFYSYLNRRLDVLVDATGKVISIGLY
ncbi:MAG: hypothetical protein P4L56_14315 [Candidatus Sulfopaludibacter sp.]|nr:hypothetical protein [Candidatus Sulfopaludibacter sp.]